VKSYFELLFRSIAPRTTRCPILPSKAGLPVGSTCRQASPQSSLLFRNTPFIKLTHYTLISNLTPHILCTPKDLHLHVSPSSKTSSTVLATLSYRATSCSPSMTLTLALTPLTCVENFKKALVSLSTSTTSILLHPQRAVVKTHLIRPRVVLHSLLEAVRVLIEEGDMDSDVFPEADQGE
jgi:hypothetical protein